MIILFHIETTQYNEAGKIDNLMFEEIMIVFLYETLIRYSCFVVTPNVELLLAGRELDFGVIGKSFNVWCSILTYHSKT